MKITQGRAQNQGKPRQDFLSEVSAYLDRLQAWAVKHDVHFTKNPSWQNGAPILAAKGQRRLELSVKKPGEMGTFTEQHQDGKWGITICENMTGQKCHFARAPEGVWFQQSGRQAWQEIASNKVYSELESQISSWLGNLAGEKN